MLLFGSQLIGTPIMGLQTGTKLAQTSSPLIDPADLKIVAYVVEGPLLSERPSLIRIEDVREFGEIGMIIDSSDEFIGLEDVIKIKELYDIGFTLIGTTVIEEKGRKLGKIDDYSVDPDSFVIQQLSVKQSIMKSLTDTSLLIHRSQIVEINDKHIIVRTTAKRPEPVTDIEKREFINPFRSIAPQTENAMSSVDRLEQL